MKKKVKAKQEAFNALVSGGIEEEKWVNKERYKITKKDAKKVVAEAPKKKVYERCIRN